MESKAVGAESVMVVERERLFAKYLCQRHVSIAATTSQMIDVLLNPVEPQVVPRQEQKRLQLQKERADEMKRFLAQQASNSHPRLVRLLKKHENPSAPITEIMLPSLIGGGGNLVGARNGLQNEPRPHAPMLSPINQPKATQGSVNYQQQHPQQIPMNQQQNPPRDSIYGFPSSAVYQQPYPTMQYQPNPYLPPFHYSPVSLKVMICVRILVST